MHLNKTLHCRLLFPRLRTEKNKFKKNLKKGFSPVDWRERLLCFLKLFIFSSIFRGSGFIACYCKYNKVILIIFFTLGCLVGLGCTTSVSFCYLFLMLNEIQRAKYVVFYFSGEFDQNLQFLGLIT